MSNMETCCKEDFDTEETDICFIAFQSDRSFCSFFCLYLFCFNLLLPHTLGTPEIMAGEIKTDRIVSGSETRSIIPVLMSLI